MFTFMKAAGLNLAIQDQHSLKFQISNIWLVIVIKLLAEDENSIGKIEGSDGKENREAPLPRGFCNK